MGYAGLISSIDECRVCGDQGIFAEDCPSYGSTEIRRVRRITGYLSTVDRFNDAKKWNWLTARLTSKTNHFNEGPLGPFSYA